MILSQKTRQEIQELIDTHVKIQQFSKQIKAFKEMRKKLELKLYNECKNRNISMFDIDKFRFYIYDTPEPRIMLYQTKKQIDS
jgi:hypothetical protein